jgi:hypothetical protein
MPLLYRLEGQAVQYGGAALAMAGDTIQVKSLMDDLAGKSQEQILTN